MIQERLAHSEPKSETVTLPDGTTEAFTRSSGNIFVDLGLPNPEERLLKAELALEINRLLKSKGLTQSAAASVTGVQQPQLSNILRGKLSGTSVEKLLTIINRLGRRVEVRIGARDVTPELAVTVVGS
jgi:predicted XRE-type DNA-binding protein